MDDITTTPCARIEQHILLKGRPSVQQFVRFIKTTAVNGHDADETLLTREWQDARSLLREIERDEAGYADVEELPPLPSQLKLPADQALRAVVTERELALLPHSWAWVELDRLVVWQRSINVSFAKSLRSSFGANMSDAALLEFASGRRPEQHPPLHVIAHDANTFSFTSPSNDLRALSILPMPPAAAECRKVLGHPAGLLGVFVGYGSNVLRGVRFGNRTVLVNGNHRTYACRLAGVTHAPCLIQHASTLEDLDLAGAQEIKQQADYFFRSLRPPLFKDYFDERLYTAISAPRQNLMLRVEIKIQQSMIPSI